MSYTGYILWNHPENALIQYVENEIQGITLENKATGNERTMKTKEKRNWKLKENRVNEK